FRHMITNVLGGYLFSGPADLANHDNRIGFGVFLKEPERVDEVCSDHRIAAYADRSRLTQTEISQLVNRFVGKSPAARNNADSSFGVNVSRHDADLTFAWRDDPRAGRSAETRIPALQI